MNHFAYYALKCEGGDFASCEAVSGCDLAGGSGFTFGMDFCWTGQGGGILFRQEGGVCCRLLDGEIHWGNDNWEAVTSAMTAALIQDGWNHLDAVYGDTQVLLYLNGIQAAQADKTGTAPASANPYRFLEEGEGYLRNVRIVDHCMTEEEIADNLLATKMDVDKLWLWLPFDAPYAQDQGKNKKKVSYPGLCRCETLVKALNFCGNGYALLDRVTVNPGSSALPSFSVAVRFYAQPCAADSVVLFENSGETDGLQICLQNGQSRLALAWGATQKTFDSLTIPSYEWTDLIVCVSATQIQVYLNGAAAGSVALSAPYTRTSSPRLCLGDGFIGSVDYLALYNHALTAEETAQIHAMEPYVFDAGIALLFLFHGEPQQNFLGAGVLMLQAGAKIGIVEGTVYDKAIEPIAFRGSDAFSGSDFDKWQASLLADVCGQFATLSTGQGVCDLQPGTMEFLWERIGKESAAQNLFLDYNVFTPEEILAVMKVVAGESICMSVLATMLSNAKYLGFLSISMDDLMYFQLAAGTALAYTFLFKVATATKQKTKDHDPPPIPVPPPEPETGYAVELLSIQFCNGKEGSVPLREEYQKNQSLPEWTSESAGAGICAYLPGKQTPKVKLKFRYIPAKDQPPVSLKVGFRSELLGNCLSAAVNCAVAGTFETQATCSGGKLEKATMGKTTEELRCYYQAGTLPEMLRTVEMEVHILCQTPLSPWSATVQEQGPLIPLLRYAGEMAALSSVPITTGEAFLDAAVTWLGNRSDCSLQENNQYSSPYKMGAAPFCAQQFVAALRSGTLSAGFLDYSLFLADLAAMEGISLAVYQLCSMENMSGNDFYCDGLLFASDCRAFGKAFPETIGRGCLLAPAAGTTAALWDPLTRNNAQPAGIKKNAWEEYRDKVLSWSCYVYDPIRLPGWTEVSSLPKQPLTVGYDTSHGMFIQSDRLGFKPYISEIFNYPQNLACCHRVSYHTIETILLDTFNGFKAEQITKEGKDKIIAFLCNGFYPAPPDPAAEKDEYKNYNALIRNASSLLEVSAADMTNNARCKTIAKKLQSLLSCLNCATRNLRTGYSTWNASIGANFDPEEWKLVVSNNGQNYTVLTQKGLQEPSEDDLPEGVYLTSAIDGAFIHMLKQIESILDASLLMMTTPSFVQEQGGQQFFYPAVRSSNNAFLANCLSDVYIECPRFYWEPDQKSWIRL